MGKYKCRFCSREMIATALSYQSNQYCNHCFNERADSTQKQNLNTFEFMGDVIKLECERSPKTTISASLLLSGASKFKKPLFKTFDGVDIFEGDRVYSVTPGFCIGYSGSLKYKPIQPCFSTKEKAEEFIVMHKPCLSIQEIKNNERKNGNLAFSGSQVEKRLKELVKNKLK